MHRNFHRIWPFAFPEKDPTRRKLLNRRRRPVHFKVTTHQQRKHGSIVPVSQNLTTQEKESLLGVFHPFFLKLLEENALPSH
jgi:hypothetical protein